MSLELCVLASGSLGNCSVLRSPAGSMLIDAGIGPRVAAQRLNGTGVSVRDIRSICLTHLDSDHFRPSWLGTIIAHEVRVYCDETRARDLLRSAADDQAEPRQRKQLRSLLNGFNGYPFEPLPGLTLHALPLAHDQLGSLGFLIEGFGCRIGYATDLGHVPRHLLDRFCDLDVLAIESNYDPEMELQSARPWFLKNRIMGGRGHLSNEQALEAVQKILDRCERKGLKLPQHVVLLHRSRECNCPRLIRRLFERDRRIAPRLVVAEQFCRSEWMRPCMNLQPSVGEQLTLAW